MARVAVTGASGFIGRAVISKLLAAGHEPVALTRRPGAFGSIGGVQVRRFDANDDESNPAAFEGADAVIHLAGESVGGRWTAEKKQHIYDSRVRGTRCVVRSLTACSRKPSVLLSASASGYYGNRGDEPLFESSTQGDDFLARVCGDWEREALAASYEGLRVACLRTGIVLGQGGALAQMLPVFRLGLGGPFGSGRQFAPWISLDDIAALYAFALDHEQLSGAINAVAPDYAVNARFAQAFGAALGRPALLPTPGIALKMAVGEFAQTLLGGQLMIPAVAQDAGFRWTYDLLEDAMSAAMGRSPASSSVRTFTAEQFVQGDADRVFAFFSDARNLQAITPQRLQFAMLHEPPEMGRGACIEYRLKVRGLPIRWKTLIAQWTPPHAFVDVQLHGPYALWEHTHSFAPENGGVSMRDRVRYALPFAPLGALAAPLVEGDIRAIFSYRNDEIARRFA